MHMINNFLSAQDLGEVVGQQKQTVFPYVPWILLQCIKHSIYFPILFTFPLCVLDPCLLAWAAKKAVEERRNQKVSLTQREMGLKAVKTFEWKQFSNVGEHKKYGLAWLGLNKPVCLSVCLFGLPGRVG